MYPGDRTQMKSVELSYEWSPQDGRQSCPASDICRGVGRLLSGLGLASVAELALPNGRRADVVALGAGGEVWIIEIKSSVEDLRSDRKWPEYRDYCDRLYFAVALAFKVELLPADTGIILADRYGGEIARPAPETRMQPARRRTMLLRFARTAAARLQALSDPGAAVEAIITPD